MGPGVENTKYECDHMEAIELPGGTYHLLTDGRFKVLLGRALRNHFH